MSQMHALTIVRPNLMTSFASFLGVIDASPIEYHAMTVALNTSSSLGNVTITRKIFNVTNEWSLIDQGKHLEELIL